jgi:hypothetical protein
MTIKKEFDSIYLIWTRESIQLDEPIYKVGKTKRIGLERFKEYPDGSELLFHISCHNCTDKETKIKELFKKKYFQASLYGTEYFGGNPNEMIKDILNITEINVKNVNTSKIAALADLHEKVFPLAKETIQSNKELNNKQVNGTSKIQHLINNNIISSSNEIINATNAEVIKDILIETDETDKTDETDNNNKINESNTKTFFCHKCDKTYKSYMGLWLHEKKYHSEVKAVTTENTNCKYCNKKLASRQSKWRHEKTCKKKNNLTIDEKFKQLTEEIKELKEQKQKPQNITNNITNNTNNINEQK